MNLENIMLSEISQTQKDKYYMISLYEVLSIVKCIETDSRMVLPGAGGKGSMEFCLMGTEFPLRKMEKFWRWMVVIVEQRYECT